MSSFTTPLELDYLDGRKWSLAREFDYVTNAGTVVHVPEGFITDFASIPRALWAALPPTGRYGKAAVVHDYLYVTAGKGDGTLGFTKPQADSIFLEAMEVLGVPWLERHVMWLAVKAFGRGAFEGPKALFW